MLSDKKNKIISFLNGAGVFFFVILIIFLPISNAVVESSVGFVFLCLVFKFILKSYNLEAIRSFFRQRINLAALVFFLCLGFSLSNSANLTLSFKAWILKWAEVIFLFYCVQIFIKQRHLKILLWAIFFSSLLIGIDGVYQKLTGFDFLRGAKITEGKDFFGISATFGHYNTYAGFLVPILFINLGFLLSLKKPKLAVVTVIFLILIIGNLLFTYSRGGWVSFLFVGLIVTLIFYRKHKNLLVFTLLIFVAEILFLPSLRERLFFIIEQGGDADRLAIWQVAFSMFKESPIVGKGIGTFMDIFQQYKHTERPLYAHNCYLQILAETGLLGLISFLWFLGEILIRGWRKISRSFDLAFAGLYFGLLAFLVHSFFDTQLFSLKLSTLFWLIAALVTININSYEEQKN